MWPTASLLGAGFDSGELCDKLDCGGYVMRLRENAALSRLADPHRACVQQKQRQYHEPALRRSVARAASWWSHTGRTVCPALLSAYGSAQKGPSCREPCEALPEERQGREAPTRAQCCLPRYGNCVHPGVKHQRARSAACTLALSSAPRPKTHYRSRRVLRRHAAKLQEGKARAPGPYCSYISCCMWGAAHAGAGGSPHAPVELPAAHPESRSTHRAASTQHCYPGSWPCPCELGVFLEALSPASVEDNSLPLLKKSDLRCSRKGAGATPGRRTHDLRDTYAHTRRLALKSGHPAATARRLGPKSRPHEAQPQNSRPYISETPQMPLECAHFFGESVLYLLGTRRCTRNILVRHKPDRS